MNLTTTSKERITLPTTTNGSTDQQQRTYELAYQAALYEHRRLELQQQRPVNGSKTVDRRYAAKKRPRSDPVSAEPALTPASPPAALPATTVRSDTAVITKHPNETTPRKRAKASSTAGSQASPVNATINNTQSTWPLISNPQLQRLIRNSTKQHGGKRLVVYDDAAIEQLQKLCLTVLTHVVGECTKQVLSGLASPTKNSPAVTASAITQLIASTDWQQLLVQQPASAAPIGKTQLGAPGGVSGPITLNEPLLITAADLQQPWTPTSSMLTAQNISLSEWLLAE